MIKWHTLRMSRHYRTRVAPILGAGLLLLLAPACRKQGPPPNPAAPPAPPMALRGDGILLGTVKLATLPAAPPPPGPTPESAQRVCGPTVSDNSLQVDRERGLASALVWVESPPLPGPERMVPSNTLDQRRCAYLPPLLAATVGAHLHVRNSDPLVHNVHARQTRGTGGGRPVFNFAMPLENMEVTRVLPMQPGQVDVGCDVHPWMKSAVMLFDHPFFTVTDAHGRFTLEGLAPGPHVLHVLHLRAGTLSAPVTVLHGAAPELALTLPAPTVAPGQK